MKPITLSELVEADAHIGCPTSSWNPRMSPYILGRKNGLHLIDLIKSKKLVNKACARLYKSSLEGGDILFIGTNPKIASILKEEAVRSTCNYINKRWKGGLLTNWTTSKSRITFLKMLDSLLLGDRISSLPKKEVAKLTRTHNSLCQSIGGLRTMDKIPDVVVVVDPDHESMAVDECRTLGIPVVSLLDTNCNPDRVDVPIPINLVSEDASRLVLSKLADAIIQGKSIKRKNLNKPYR
jgi:small subunit ribosomal protein S2